MRCKRPMLEEISTRKSQEETRKKIDGVVRELGRDLGKNTDEFLFFTSASDNKNHDPLTH